MLLENLEKKIRPKTFKKHFLSKDETRIIGEKVKPGIEIFEYNWRHKLISDAEFCAFYLLEYIRTLRPHDWKGGPHSDLDISHFKFTNSPIDIFSKYSIRSIPLAANRSLCFWAKKKYPLICLDYIPEPFELLAMQAEGVRCITVMLNDNLLSWVKNDRDPFSFLIHDLEHADHFYKDLENAKAQIGFARFMKMSIEKGLFDTFLASDEVFKKEFEYGISDMNTNGLHLLKYLKSVILSYFIRKEFGDPKAKATPDLINELNHFLQNLLLSWTDDQTYFQSFLKLNTQFEEKDDIQRLYQLLLSKGEPREFEI